jgi:two-component system cell cycle response regulator DivK
VAELILAVDDDETMTKMLRDILQAEGYRVIEARSGKEAIELAASEKPDLITMDLLMPEISGLDAIRKLKADEATKKIPIIVITAAAMKGEDRLSIEAGCADFLIKPFSIDVLLEKVIDVIHQNGHRSPEV